jgi:hypothetical protein
VDSRAGLNDMKKWTFFTLSGLEFRPFGRPTRSQSLYPLSYRCSKHVHVTPFINKKSALTSLTSSGIVCLRTEAMKFLFRVYFRGDTRYQWDKSRWAPETVWTLQGREITHHGIEAWTSSRVALRCSESSQTFVDTLNLGCLHLLRVWDQGEGGAFRLRNVNIVDFTIYSICYMFWSYDHLQVDIFSRICSTDNRSVVLRFFF